jgi:hypothetical protein
LVFRKALDRLAASRNGTAAVRAGETSFINGTADFPTLL